MLGNAAGTQDAPDARQRLVVLLDVLEHAQRSHAVDALFRQRAAAQIELHQRKVRHAAAQVQQRGDDIIGADHADAGQTAPDFLHHITGGAAYIEHHGHLTRWQPALQRSHRQLARRNVDRVRLACDRLVHFREFLAPVAVLGGESKGRAGGPRQSRNWLPPRPVSRRRRAVSARESRRTGPRSRSCGR